MSRTQLREPVLSNELPGRIITGKVLIKASVKEVKENSVVFNNTPKEEPIDITVFATGYTFAFPFLHETVVKVEDGQASLYKYNFPAHLQKPTLAVIGLIKPLGSMITTGEMQARWAVQVLKGKCMSNSRMYMFSLPCYFGYWKFRGLPQVLSKTTQSHLLFTKLHYHSEFVSWPAQKINHGSKNISCVYLLFCLNQLVQLKLKSSINWMIKSSQASCEGLSRQMSSEMFWHLSLQLMALSPQPST